MRTLTLCGSLFLLLASSTSARANEEVAFRTALKAAPEYTRTRYRQAAKLVGTPAARVLVLLDLYRASPDLVSSAMVKRVLARELDGRSALDRRVDRAGLEESLAEVAVLEARLERSTKPQARTRVNDAAKQAAAKAALIRLDRDQVLTNRYYLAQLQKTLFLRENAANRKKTRLSEVIGALFREVGENRITDTSVRVNGMGKVILGAGIRRGNRPQLEADAKAVQSRLGPGASLSISSGWQGVLNVEIQRKKNGRDHRTSFVVDPDFPEHVYQPHHSVTGEDGVVRSRSTSPMTWVRRISAPDGREATTMHQRGGSSGNVLTTTRKQPWGREATLRVTLNGGGQAIEAVHEVKHEVNGEVATIHLKPRRAVLPASRLRRAQGAARFPRLPPARAGRSR